MASSLVVAKNNVVQAEPCWLFDAGPETGFQVSSRAIHTELEGALKAQRGLIKFTTGAHNYEVDLESMVQRNIKTGTQRAVIRVLLTTTHAVLDRDSARVFRSLSYKDIVVWIKKHAAEAVSIDRKLLDKGKLMTMATALFHSSTEFPVLQHFDGTPCPIKNKAGKVIQGGAKPTVLNDVPLLPAPVPRPFPVKKIVCDKEWAVKLVTGTDNAELATQVVSVEDLTEACSSLLAQFYVFKQGMPSDAKVLTLFHGTGSAVVSKVTRSGFDWRYNQRHVYGKGNYFAATAGYAIGVAPAEGGMKTVIVAKVVYCKAAKGASSMMLPPEGFDATADDETAPNIYVTYKVCSSFLGPLVC